MNIFSIFLNVMIGVIGVFGGVLTIGMFIGMFAVIGWKIYRKIRYGISLYQ